MSIIFQNLSSKYNLHSSMVLLISNATISFKYISAIYIPVWFYLYQLQVLHDIQIHLYLHSSMVLLIFHSFTKVCSASVKFTFQYGSTYIYYYLHQSYPSTLFTFQYGSTYIVPGYDGYVTENKFTFQYGSTYIFQENWVHFQFSYIYIPVWFYLYTLPFQVRF